MNKILDMLAQVFSELEEHIAHITVKPILAICVSAERLLSTYGEFIGCLCPVILPKEVVHAVQGQCSALL